MSLEAVSVQDGKQVLLDRVPILTFQLDSSCTHSQCFVQDMHPTFLFYGMLWLSRQFKSHKLNNPETSPEHWWPATTSQLGRGEEAKGTVYGSVGFLLHPILRSAGPLQNHASSKAPINANAAAQLQEEPQTLLLEGNEMSYQLLCPLCCLPTH